VNEERIKYGGIEVDLDAVKEQQARMALNDLTLQVENLLCCLSPVGARDHSWVRMEAEKEKTQNVLDRIRDNLEGGESVESVADPRRGQPGGLPTAATVMMNDFERNPEKLVERVVFEVLSRVGERIAFRAGRDAFDLRADPVLVERQTCVELMGQLLRKEAERQGAAMAGTRKPEGAPVEAYGRPRFDADLVAALLAAVEAPMELMLPDGLTQWIGGIEMAARKVREAQRHAGVVAL